MKTAQRSQWFAQIAVAAILFAGQTCLAAGASYSNPVLAGDYPDPSIIRVGDDFWATATSSEWAPLFPLLHSRDLVNWEIVGSVFTDRPKWAVANFWAPEISEWHGQYAVYYVGHKRGGSLGVAVAIASKPDGPYVDQGLLVSQPDGSIDPVPVTDENGQRWLVWKEDGNSQKRPTPIWAQQLNDGGTQLVGQAHELIRNDARWEGPLVEAPFVLHRNDWFYLFYSGNGCCGARCNYAEGVARSHSLLGPWTKDPQNPILAGNRAWKCPGHGSIAMDQHGRYWFLHHAYDAGVATCIGRELMLDEVTFGGDDWPQFNDGSGPTVNAPSPLGAVQNHAELMFSDDFKAASLAPGWQWPVQHKPVFSIEPGHLLLSPAPQRAGKALGGILARSTTSGDYVATVAVDASALKNGATAGLAAIGDPDVALGISFTGEKLIAWEERKGQQQIIAELPGINWPVVHLRLTATGGFQYQAAASPDGADWKDQGPTLDAHGLPPWDRGVRIGLVVGGPDGASAQFASFHVEPVAK